jgi:hypothetical protein
MKDPVQATTYLLQNALYLWNALIFYGVCGIAPMW